MILLPEHLLTSHSPSSHRGLAIKIQAGIQKHLQCISGHKWFIRLENTDFTIFIVTSRAKEASLDYMHCLEHGPAIEQPLPLRQEIMGWKSEAFLLIVIQSSRVFKCKISESIPLLFFLDPSICSTCLILPKGACSILKVIHSCLSLSVTLTKVLNPPASFQKMYKVQDICNLHFILILTKNCWEFQNI